MNRWIVGLTLILVATYAWGEDAELLKKQKAAAGESFAKGHSGARATAETPHLLLYGTVTEAKLKSLGTGLEKHYATATKGLQFDAKSSPWEGKLAVLVFADGAEVRAFIRAVEKRSPRGEEAATSVVRGDTPHLAIAAGTEKEAANLEANAAKQLATALLYAKARTRDIPDWLVSGFATATVNQGTSAATRKRAVAKLGLPAAAAWKDETPAEARKQVAASLSEYLIYAKGTKLGPLLDAFRPLEGQEEIKETWVGLALLELTPEKLDSQWRQWLAKP